MDDVQLVLDRRAELIARKYAIGLTSAEEEELKRLQPVAENLVGSFYEPLTARLREIEKSASAKNGEGN